MERWAGARGVAWDVTDQDEAESAAARATRRSELTGQILGHMRTEVMASRMMIRALHTLAGALGADGAMMLDGEAKSLGEPGDIGALLSDSGGDVPALRQAGAARLADGAAGPLALQTAQGHTALLCATPSRFGGCPGVVVWRHPGRRWLGRGGRGAAEWRRGGSGDRVGAWGGAARDRPPRLHGCADRAA